MGHEVVFVNGTSVEGMNATEVIDRIKASVGVVTLTVRPKESNDPAAPRPLEMARNGRDDGLNNPSIYKAKKEQDDYYSCSWRSSLNGCDCSSCCCCFLEAIGRGLGNISI